MKTDAGHTGVKNNTNRSARRRGISLRHKLLAWFLLVALTPVTLVGIVSYNSAKESMRAAVEESLATITEEKTAFINNWFHYRFTDLESQATNAANTRFLKELREAHEADGKNVGEFVRSYRWHTIVDRWGEDLREFRKLYEYYDVFLIDAEGNILFTVAEEDDLGTNLFTGSLAETRFAIACRNALETGHPTFSDLERYAPSNGEVSGFLASVILDEDGEKIGVFAILITHDQIEYIMQRKAESKSGIRSYIVGYSSEEDSLSLRSSIGVEGGPKTNPGSGLETPDSRYGASLGRVVDTDQTRLWIKEHGKNGVESVEQEEVVFVYDGPDGDRVLGVHGSVFVADTKWCVIVEMPESLAFASVFKMEKLVLGMLFSTCVVVVIISTLITGRIVRPIVRLAEMVASVARGDLEQRSRFGANGVRGANDEIGQLANSFNEMVVKLDQMFAELSNMKLALDKHAVVSMTDIRGNITYANDKFIEISGYSREELIGSNHRLVKSDEHSPEFFRTLWKTVSGGEIWSGEVKNCSKDGEDYWVEATIVPFRDGAGKITKYVAIRTDITQLKRALDDVTENEEILKEAFDQLESAMQDAKAANRSKSEFLANMSHEIRTPMTAILGFADLLSKDDEVLQDPEQRLNAITTIRRNGKHLLQIINDILDLSKIEAGKLVVEQIRCSLVQVVADVQSLMQVRADAGGLTMGVEFIGPIPETIESDPTRIKQILINLLGNAIKFTKTGGVRIITRLDEKGARPLIRFEVIDTGIGMSPEQSASLFQAFQQADTSTTRKFGGTGLGLVISKRMAELLGGDITIESRTGEGSTFHVTILAGDLEGVKMLDAPNTSAFAEPEAVEASKPTAKALDCHILFAEDGVDNQRLISFVLKKAGATVTVVENGKLAVDAALAARDDGAPFDVILMDMQMPVMDGYTAVGLLREKGYTNPIIALTAHAMAADRLKCIDAGCDDFATKPIDRPALIELISGFTRRSAAAA